MSLEDALEKSVWLLECEADAWATCFFVNDRFALTAYHNVCRRGDGDKLRAFNKHAKPAWLRWDRERSNEDHDIAILERIDPEQGHEFLTMALLPDDCSCDSKPAMRFWACRRVAVFGFPALGQNPTSRYIEGAFLEKHPIIDIYDSISHDRRGALLSHRLVLSASNTHLLKGISGAPICDTRTNFVIGVQGAYLPNTGGDQDPYAPHYVFGTPLCKLRGTCRDLLEECGAQTLTIVDKHIHLAPHVLYRARTFEDHGELEQLRDAWSAKSGVTALVGDGGEGVLYEFVQELNSSDTQVFCFSFEYEDDDAKSFELQLHAELCHSRGTVQFPFNEIKKALGQDGNLGRHLIILTCLENLLTSGGKFRSAANDLLHFLKFIGAGESSSAWVMVATRVRLKELEDSQYYRSIDRPHTVVNVVVITDIDNSEDLDAELNRLCRELAAKMGCRPESIIIKDYRLGSLVVTLEIPRQHANTLVNAFHGRAAPWNELLTEFRIRDILVSDEGTHDTWRDQRVALKHVGLSLRMTCEAIWRQRLRPESLVEQTVADLRSVSSKDLSDTDFAEALIARIGLHFRRWSNDIVIGPYVEPLIKVLCQDIAGRPSIALSVAARIVSFFCDHDNPDNDTDNEAVAKFYEFLSHDTDLWPTPPVRHSLGFHCVKPNGKPGIAAMFPEGMIVFRGESVSRRFGLQHQGQKTIRIPICQSVEGNLIQRPAVQGLTVNVPETVLGTSVEEVRVAVSFIRGASDGKSLRYEVRFYLSDKLVEDQVSHSISGLLQEITDEEERGLRWVHRWREPLRHLADALTLCVRTMKRIQSAGMSESEPYVSDFPGSLSEHICEWEQHRDSALKALRDAEFLRSGRKAVENIIEFIATDEEVATIAAIAAAEDIFAEASLGEREASDNLIAQLLSALKRNRLDSTSEILQQLLERTVGAIEDRVSTNANLSAIHKVWEFLSRRIERTAEMGLLMFNRHDLSTKLLLQDENAVEAHHVLGQLLRIVETLIDQYKDCLDPWQVEHFQSVRQGLAGTASEPSAESLIVVQTLWNQLVPTGFPGVLATVEVLLTEASLPAEAALSLRIFHTLTCKDRGLYSQLRASPSSAELRAFHAGVAQQMSQAIEGIEPQPSIAALLVLMTEMQKMLEPPPGPHEPLGDGQEEIQVAYLLNALSSVIGAGQSRAYQDAYYKALESGDYAQLRRIANELSWSLVALGAPTVAFIVRETQGNIDASFEMESDEVSMMLHSFERGVSGWKLHARRVLSELRLRLVNHASEERSRSRDLRFTGKMLGVVEEYVELGEGKAKANLDAWLSDADITDSLSAAVSFSNRLLESKYATLLSADEFGHVQNLLQYGKSVLYFPDENRKKEFNRKVERLFSKAHEFDADVTEYIERLLSIRSPIQSSAGPQTVDYKGIEPADTTDLLVEVGD